MEAQSCGVSVVGFNIAGMEDVVLNNKTGYLVDPFDTKKLSDKIFYPASINNKKIKEDFSINSELRAKNL